MEKKDQVIEIRCSSKDVEIFSTLAKHLNVSLSTFMLTSASVGAEFLVRYIDSLKENSLL